MGGSGSGNRWRWGGRDKVESTRSIDVRRWQRLGYFAGASWFNWQWSRDGKQVALIGVRIQDRYSVVLNYQFRRVGEEEWQSVEQRVPISWTECHFGGDRPWFICSVYRNGVYCGRRVAKLYGAGKLFACRDCYNLAYESQNEMPDGRALLKAQNIRVKLGGSASLGDPFPPKPKCAPMHH